MRHWIQWALVAACLICLAAPVAAQEEALPDDAAIETAAEPAAEAAPEATTDAAAEEHEAVEAPAVEEQPAEGEVVEAVEHAPAEPGHAEAEEVHGGPEQAEHAPVHGEAAAEGHGETHGEAHGGHHGIDWFTWAITVINFAILVYLLIRFGKGPINGFLTNRRKVYLEALEEARRQKAEADAAYKEYTEKLTRIQAEATEIIERSKQDAERRKNAIIEAAEKAAERMKNDARMTIDNELLKAQTEIRAALAELVLKKAESVLAETISDADRTRLHEEFLKKLEEAS